jgi:hypothetical protein
VEIFELRFYDCAFGGVGLLFGVVDDGLKDVVEGGLDGVFFDSESGGGVALRVRVDEKDAFVFEGESGGEVNGGGCFADPSFLIHDAVDGHRSLDYLMVGFGVRVASKGAYYFYWIAIKLKMTHRFLASESFVLSTQR